MLQEKEIQLQEKDRQLQELLQDKDKQLKEKDKQLIEKDRQLIEKDRQLIEKDKQLIEKDKQLEKRATQLYEAVSQLQEAVRDLQKQQQQLQDKDKILNEKAEEIKNKDRQLQEALIQLQKKERQREEWWQQIACNVQKHEKLASGAWGVVYKGILPVAIKELKSTAPQSLQLFRREKEAAFFCHHCNIVQFWGAGKDLRLCPNIVMELMDGNLRDFIKHQNYRMQQKDIVSIALDVAKGLSYLHQHNPPILHRDLKTDNILLKRGTAKIGDLGSAKFQRDNMTWNCGTYIYTAPEVLNSNIQTPKVSKHFSFLFFSFFLIFHCGCFRFLTNWCKNIAKYLCLRWRGGIRKKNLRKRMRISLPCSLTSSEVRRWR